MVIRFAGQSGSTARNEPKLSGFRCWNLNTFPAVNGKKKSWTGEVKTVTSWVTMTEDKPSTN